MITEHRYPNALFTGGFSRQQHRAVEDPANGLLQHVMAFDAVQAFIAAGVVGQDPFLAGRFGSTEGKICGQILLGEGRVTDETLRSHAHANSGIFPNDDPTLERFADEYIRSILATDLLALWNFSGSVELALAYSPVQRRYCFLEDLTPLPGFSRVLKKELPSGSAVPWTKSLAGKRVLVVHPFERSIRAQYERKDTIHGVSEILPDFDLLTMRPPVTFLDADLSGSEGYFAELQKASKQIQELEFDVALVSAGGYGLPLAAFAKSMGRKAIHMGGAGQLLFGITGERWAQPRFKAIHGENWVRPLEDEMVKGSEKIKNCYW
jgi:hypothetical protein